jgi:hypothetical protein
MVADRDGQGLLRFVLLDHETVQVRFNLLRRGVELERVQSFRPFFGRLVGRSLLGKRGDCDVLAKVRLHELLDLLLEFFGRRKRCLRHP